MDRKRWGRTACVAVCMFALLVPAVSAWALPPETETPVVLRLNDDYLLYAYPVAPYVNEQDRLMIPLRAFGGLFGATIDYDEQRGKAATIMEGEHAVTMFMDSDRVFVDGIPSTMDTKAIEKNGAMIVPIRILIDTFGFQAEIGAHGVVVLKDDRLLHSGKPLCFTDVDTFGLRKTDNPDAFVPLTYSVIQNKTKAGGVESHVTVTYQNVSGMVGRSQISSTIMEQVQLTKWMTIARYPKDANGPQ